MEIKRIRDISNIGTFACFTNGGPIGFEKLTFIYGLNTFGKTTLSDIFQSLKDNDSSVITRRKTIPEIQETQKACVVVKEESTNENNIQFDGNQWTTNNVGQYLEVFGTDFIHKNVFTGLTFQRSNKENLTSFILGDQGVNLAEDIKQKKQQLGEMKRSLKEKKPSFAKNFGDEDLTNFLNFDITGINKETTDKQLAQTKVLLGKEQEKLKEPAKIINLPEPQEFNFNESDLLESLSSLNKLLTKSYENIKDESIRKLDEHIKSCFQDTDNAKNWIKQGLHYCIQKITGKCPFCGQLLSNAKDLIDLYDSYFDEAYSKYIDEITVGLRIHLNTFKNSKLKYKTILQTTLIKSNQYKELIADSNFQNYLAQLEKVIQDLNEEELERKKESMQNQFELNTANKLKSPHEKIEEVDISAFEQSFKAYIALLKQSSSLSKELVEHIGSFKNAYRNTKYVEDEIQNLSNAVAQLEYKKARIEQDKDCTNYKKLLNDISNMESGENGIGKLEEKLEENQTQFLNNYFNNINVLFKRFGSKNFTLQKNEDRRGHMPVYSLSVKFHDKEIAADHIDSVFSESDRRALALAVFFARVELRNDADLSKTVIILDDPVTSFDDNRISQSINYLKEILHRCSQVIILTHYSSLIKRFCEITKEQQLTVKFIKIEQNEFTSYLSGSCRNDFATSDYEKTFARIYDFINRKHNYCIKTDLRPFLEQMYLPTVFSKKIADDNIDCSSLELMIDGVFSDNESVKSKFHKFRNTLNADSHILTSNNDEDVRNFAEEMFDYIFSIQVVNSISSGHSPL